MPVLRINAQDVTPVLHGEARPLRGVLKSALAQDGPVVIMLHGYKFLPHDAKHCPHKHIFALEDSACRKGVSWPKRLGMAAEQPGEGLAVAFGWNARGSLWQARERGKDAAHALATLVKMIRQMRPNQPVHLLAHSMGAFVALRAMPYLQAHDIGRLISMNGALYRKQAERALASDAGRAAEFIHMVSRENRMYEALFEYALRPDDQGDRAIGRSFAAGNALTIDVSDQVTLDVLATLGHPIARPNKMLCHWSTYLRPGVFGFYQALLRQPVQTPLPYLKSALEFDVPHLSGAQIQLPSMPDIVHRA